MHDEEYLKAKYNSGEKGEKLPYSWNDIRVSEGYDMEIAFIRAKAKLKHTSVNMATRLQSGEDNPLSLILQGENVYTVNALMRALTQTDYQRLSNEYAACRSQLDMLMAAIDAYGLIIDSDADGKIYLSKKDDT